jgi:hypothetical protein
MKGRKISMGHAAVKLADIKLYEGKWTDGTKANDPERFEVSKTFNGRVGVTADEKIFGLVRGWHMPHYLPEVPELSHMSYRLDEYFRPAEVIARMREEGQLKIFLFNAGGMGMSALWAEVDDMERAFQELDLL